MSMVFNESFFAFGDYNGSDSFDASVGAANQARAAYTLNLVRAGYQVVTATNAAKDSSGGWLVRPDPVYPERNVLTHSSDAGPTINLGVSAAIRKQLPITDKQVIVGFSMYVPPEYVPNPANSTVPVFRMNASFTSDATWSAVAIVVASAKECFRVCNDLSIRWGTDAAQSSRKLTVGVINYLEVRISATDVSIWIDDVFVAQKSVSLIPQSIGFIFENNANAGSASGGTNMSGLPGRWALGNMYYMFVDGVAPQARLGPTTRVIGQRPDTDVDVRFVRPAAYSTNASVAAQDLVDNPPATLQSNAVGDYDLYQTATGTTGDAIRSMAMVHAVSVKSLAQNLEPDVHRIRPYMRSGASAVDGADIKPKEFSPITSPTTRTIRGMFRHPNGSIFMYGEGETIYMSGANSNTDTWTPLLSTGTTATIVNHFIRSDGLVLFYSFIVGSTTAGNVYMWTPNDPTTITKGTAAIPATTNGGGGVFLAADGSFLVLVGADNQGTTNLSNNYVMRLAAANLNGGAPQNVAPTVAGMTFTPSTPAPAVGGWAGSVSKPDWSITVIFPNVNNADSSYRSASAGGIAVTQAAHGLSGYNFRCGVWDGSQFLIAATSSGYNGGAPAILSSPDGGSWSTPTPIGNTSTGANVQLRFGASNLAGESMFGGDNGAMVMTLDGRNWRQLPRVTTLSLYAGAVASNGDFIVGGANGVLLRQRSLGADTQLTPLAGYQMAYGSAVFNPATAAPWTPAQAADAKFGVKLVS